MLEDVLDLIDRQHDFIQGQRGVRALFQLRRYFDVLDKEPRAATVLRDLETEAFAAFHDFSLHQQALEPRLSDIRDQLVRLHPKIDDAGTAPPTGNDILSKEYGAQLRVYDRSLANFEATAKRVREAPTPPRLDTGGDESELNVLIRILRQKLELAKRWQQRQSERRRLEKQLDEIAGQHGMEFRRLERDIGALASFALLRMRAVAHAAGHEWNPGNEARTAAWARTLLRQRTNLADLVLSQFLEGLRWPKELVGDLSDEAETMAAVILEEEALLHNELRIRVGTTRARLALIHRFRQRCEWYDYEELRELATRGRPEARLTRALARYLFDQGLNPIIEPLTGRLRPDVLDPSLPQGFYLEAKQYSKPARKMIKLGAWQAHETLAHLRASNYEVREGYYVVFRRDGPRYAFPERVPGEGWTLFPILIDLAPDIGSRTRTQTRAFSVDDLGPRAA